MESAIAGDAAGRTARAPSAGWALASLSLATLLPSLGTSIANVGLPTLAQAFTASFQQVQWVVIAYLLAITTLIVSAGRLGDLTGRRRLLLGGLFVFTMASAVCGAAPTLWLLIGARAVQGVGAAIMMALAMALVGETVPKERTGSAMGVLGTVSAIGTALGPSLGGVVIAAFGWRAIFFVNVPLGILALLLAHRHLPFDRRIGQANQAGNSRVGLAGTKADASSTRLSMFHDTTLRASLVMSALVSAVMMSTLVVGPFYLSRSLGLGASQIGVVMSIGPIVAAMTSVPAGRFADRVGAFRMKVAGLCGMAISTIALSVLPATLGIPGYVVPIAVVTASYAAFQTANNASVMAAIDRDQRGAISGMLNLARNLGLIGGASVMGAVFARASGAIDIATAGPDAVAAGMRITFAVAAILIVIALVIAVGSRSRAAVRCSAV